MKEKACTCIPRVSCNVKTCIHNENGCSCDAPTIDVNNAHAHEAGDTCCNTFQEKQG